jgi:hypothetical protein
MVNSPPAGTVSASFAVSASVNFVRFGLPAGLPDVPASNFLPS